MTSRHVRVALGFASGGVFLYLAVRHARAADLLRVLATAKIGWLALALFLYWLELGARVMRWGALLSYAAKLVPFKATAPAFIIGYAANNLLPAKIGELVRVDLISRLTGISRMASLGTVVIERIFDVLLILLMAGISIGLLVLPETFDLARLRSGMLLLAIVSAVLLVALVLLGLGGSSAWKLRPAAHARLANLVSGIRILVSPEKCGRVLALSLLIWALNGLAMWLIVFGLGVSLTLLQTLLLMGIVGLAAVLPAPPAGLGVLQYAFLLGFELLGKSTAVGLVASATVQVALLGSVTLVGAFLFFAVIIPLPVEARATDARESSAQH